MTVKALYPIVRPTLNLNFAKTKRLDPRITFSRSSSGTYVDANGVIQSAATNVARFDHNPTTGESLGLLVEEARTNKESGSEFHDWATSAGTAMRYAGIAPNNMFTATMLYPSSSIIKSTIPDHTPANTYSSNWSVTFYAKPVTTSTGTIMFSQGGTGNTLTFNFATLQFTGSSVYVNAASYTAFANGWYKITLAPAYLYNAYFLGLYTNASSVLVWGFQLENANFPTAYIPTPATFTSRASTATYYDANGVIQTAGSNVARSAAFFPDSNGVMRSAGLLLETAATNIIFPSSPSSAGWAPTPLSNYPATSGITFNQANTLTGGNTAASFNSGSSQLNYGAGTITSGSVLSFYITGVTSTVTFSFLFPSTGGGSITVSPSYAVAVSSNGGWATNATISNVGKGWYRVSVVLNATSSNCQFNITGGNSGVLLDLFQLETGAYPTSYIPTTTTTVTRAADVSSSATVTRSADVATITGNNFSGWYNTTNGGGTIFANYRSPSIGAAAPGHIWSFDGGGVRWLAYWGHFQIYDGTSGFGIVPSNVLTSPVKEAVSLERAGDGITRESVARNGVLTTASGVSRTAGMTILSIGYTTNVATYLNGTIARLAYYPTRLSDGNLQALTAS